MFEFLFKYPSSIFRKGHFVLLSPWSVWFLVCAIALAAALLFWHVRRNRGLLTGFRPVAIWLLETGLVALVLFLLWHPALSIATLRPQQNVVAVLVDDSRSMALNDGGGRTRSAQAADLLKSGFLDKLERKFQVRLYRFGSHAERIPSAARLQPTERASHLGDSLQDVLAESSMLPLGAVVVLSDGADNLGGIDLKTVSEIRSRRIPVHTVGFGAQRMDRDVEIEDVDLPVRALPESRLSAAVTFRQYGYSGKTARLTVREGGKAISSREVSLKRDGDAQTEALLFNAGKPGPKALTISLEPLAGEQNQANNSLTRVVNVTSRKPRILYIEGEPRWEYKFIRRAIDDDPTLQLPSMLRTTQNKIYRQGLSDPKELADGFPGKAEDLFAYDGLIIGSVEAAYFTPAQQELIREFANRRGGGILFLAGRYSLSDGGYVHSPLVDLIPVKLADAKGTFHRDFSPEQLTAAGRESMICRLVEDPQANVERWKKMPMVANYQDVGEAKPGALVLMEVVPAGKRASPLLVTENYGRGRTALFATAGSWRWRMWQDHTDTTHATFWQQLLRYLVSDTPGHVTATTPVSVVPDQNRIRLRAEVRNKSYEPDAGARVEARVMAPGGVTTTVEMTPEPSEEGVFSAEIPAGKPGTYVAEVVAHGENEDLGNDVAIVEREDGVAENFRTAQNRDLLEKLSDQTGGRYYTPSGASKLPEEIEYSEAGITTRETRDLWDMPAIFLLALMLRGGEWVLRRRWGVV